MLRVLLVFDDYTELALTETYLKKIGFDVLGVMNELGIQERILSFNPEAMIISGKSAKVSSFSLGKKLKENLRYEGKVILIVPKGVRPDPSELMRMKMDALMEAPIQPERLLQILGKYSGNSPDFLIEKLHKARLSDPDLNQKLTMVTGKTTPKEKPKSERTKKYEQFIAETEIDPRHTHFDRQEMKKRQNDMKKDWDFNNLEEIDKLKRQFASALFKKK